MSEKLTVNVKQNKNGYEGTVQLSGLKTTKLTSKTGSTSFPTSSAVKTVARSVGTRLGLEVSYVEPTKKLAAKPKSSAKKAAKPTSSKKSTKCSASKAPKTACTKTCSNTPTAN